MLSEWEFDGLLILDRMIADEHRQSCRARFGAYEELFGQGTWNDLIPPPEYPDEPPMGVITRVR